MFRPNEIAHKFQHLFAGGRCSTGTRAFVQSVQDNEHWWLPWQFEHALETFFKGGITGLLEAITTLGVQSIKEFPAAARVNTELKEQGRQQARMSRFEDSL